MYYTQYLILFLLLAHMQRSSHCGNLSVFSQIQLVQLKNPAGLKNVFLAQFPIGSTLALNLETLEGC